MYSVVMMSRDLYTPGQVALLCSVSRQQVWDWCNSGRLAAVHMPRVARGVYITNISLEGWMRGWKK